MKKALAVSALALVACAKKPPPVEQTAASAAPPATVPPVATSPTPPGEPSAAVDPAAPPYEQARAYVASGQLWLARLTLEPKALGADGTRPEIELLGQICEKQGDAACTATCAQKLGKKGLDGGAPPSKKKRRR